MAEAVEAVADEDAVFVDQWDDVGHRADGGEAGDDGGAGADPGISVGTLRGE